MKLSLLIAGFNRSLSHTWPGIKANVIEPLREYGIDVEIQGAISRSKNLVTNIWSKENGITEWDVPEPDYFSVLDYFEQEDIDVTIKAMSDLARTAGDPWPEVHDNFASLQNHLRFLYLIKKGYEKIPFESNTVFFMRPDLYPVDRLEVDRYFKKDSSGAISERFLGIVTPHWQQWEGLNDRVAIISRPFARIYLSRFDEIPHRVAEAFPIHSETYLKHSLRDVPVHPLLKEFFGRIRVGGERSRYDKQERDY
ncbi:MAG: hypothetical protein WCO85_06080 [Actinomycetes bacterium]